MGEKPAVRRMLSSKLFIRLSAMICGNRLPWRLVVFGVFSMVAVWVGFLKYSPYDAGQLVRNWGYYTISITFTGWVWCLLRVTRGWIGGLPPGWWRVASAALALTAVAVMTTPYTYKVLYDELVIQTTAIALSQDRVVGAIGRAYELWGRLQISMDYVDKRPFFFPFLVSILHDWTGYREASAFWLNTLLMPVVLGLAYSIGRRLAGTAAGWVALVSLGSFSLLAINATGAGLEMLNLALILGLVWTGGHYLEKPEEGDRLSLFVLTSVLLANTRYESGIYIVTAGLVIFEGWRRDGIIRLPLMTLAAPLFLIPYAWQNSYLSGMPVLWELRAGQEDRFSLDYFTANLAFARRYFGNFGMEIANSQWLTWAGLIAMIGWMVMRARQRRQWGDVGSMEWSAVACGLGVFANLGLLLAYYWGDLSDPIVSRLSLPVHALLAILVGGAVAWLARVWRPVAVPAAIFAALTAYTAWGLPVNQRLNDFNLVAALQRWELSVINDRVPMTRLVITDRSPLFWFCQGISSSSTRRAVTEVRGLAYHWQHHSFDEVLVMQELAPCGPHGEMMVVESAMLPDAVKLESIAQTRIAGRVHRISRIIDIKMDELLPRSLLQRNHDTIGSLDEHT